jgi:hypothetical protein
MFTRGQASIDESPAVPRQSKSAVIEGAWQAHNDGRRYYAPKFNSPEQRRGALADLGEGPVGNWAELIEAVEDYGFELVQWSTARNPQGHVCAYPVFRKVHF